jgi:hypothetical protein
MDPAGIIVAALTAGAISALRDTANEAVKDAYKALRELILKKFETDTKARAALRSYEKKPKNKGKQLENAIKQYGVDKDKRVLAAAKRLSKVIKVQGIGSIYDVKFYGDVKGIIQGNDAKVTMNFNETQSRSIKKKRD